MLKQLPIILLPKPVLRQVAKEVATGAIKTSEIQKLISSMKETLKNTADGVGLAAPQVGESLRIFLVSEEAEYVDNKKLPESVEKRSEDKKRDWKYFVYINPVVKKISKGKIEYPEGCLSVPGKFGIVKRNEKITVEAYDETGRKFTRGASKFFARVIQHELDHLNGTIFIDKVERYLDVPSNGTKGKGEMENESSIFMK